VLKGLHLIAGEWTASDQVFENQPIEGASDRFAATLPEHMERAVEAAEDAFLPYAELSREARADFLEAIADEIDARLEVIQSVGPGETGLPSARFTAETGRTTGQLRYFAKYIRAGDYLDARHDAALPDRQPSPRPDLKLRQEPIGPVAVFGASNFPMAFSVAGGDTASALAAGCPVVVKGHSAHPGTSELVAQAIDTAIRKKGIPAGVFSLLQGGKRDVSQALVRHPLIQAVGFTGSLRGGRALYDICAARPVPIPFYGELGSVNPMFLLPGASAHRREELAEGWAASLTMGAGQFCTNPGVAVVLEAHAEEFARLVSNSLETISGQPMLTEGICQAFNEGQNFMLEHPDAVLVLGNPLERRVCLPQLFMIDADAWLRNDRLQEEVFGPLGLIVKARSVEQMEDLARALPGQLTVTIHLDDSDYPAAQALLPALRRKAGRILLNGFPTGVEVCDSMVHGGPYPASTNFGHTSVGSMAIRRWLRPVCYQNFPDRLLPR